MTPVRRPTSEDAGRATRLVLSAIGQGDLDEIRLELFELHPRHNTFPGELFIEIAVDALDEADFTRASPLSHEDFPSRYLSDYELRGRDLQRLRYALLCVAAIRGGVEPDLLDEVAYWGSDNFWQFAMLALLGYVRAAAEHLGTNVEAVCRRVAEKRNVII